MLSRQFSSSSSSSKKSSSPAPANLKNNTKKQCTNRSALMDLNRTNSSNSTCSSSVSSIEASRGGCLHFFLSNSKTPQFHRPKIKSLSKTTTPKSAPNVIRPSKLPSSSSSSSLSSRSKLSKENQQKPTSQKLKKNPPCLYQWQSAKKPASKTALNKSKNPSPDIDFAVTSNSAHGSEKFNHNHKLGESTQLLQQLPDLINHNISTTTSVENCTPIGKLACGSALGCPLSDAKPAMEDEDATSSATNTANKTPPVQASLSPEIQCGVSSTISSIWVSTSVTPATPSCYGAGHHVSGVVDRRKCRPRGILTVGDNDLHKINNDDDDDDGGDDDGNDDSVVEGLIGGGRSCVSLFPLPAEASMHWLLSPCDEDGEGQKGDLADKASLDSGHGFSLDTCDVASFNNTSNLGIGSKRTTKITLLSPIGFPGIQTNSLGPKSDQVTPDCKAINSVEERKYRYGMAGESSPFSIDSSLLSSGNLIQTPQSDSNSSSDRHVSTCFPSVVDDNQRRHVNSELDFVEEVLRRASLSPKSWTSTWDQPVSNFPFTDMTTLPTNSLDFAHILKNWDDHSPCDSSSTMENVAPSQMRISWRDGLMSRIFEMDEFDCCRCLSDDENYANESGNDTLISNPSQDLNVETGKDDTSKDFGFGFPELIDHEPVIDGKREDKFAFQQPNSCSESISTSGGYLVASGDSDWTLCYKNQLFNP